MKGEKGRIQRKNVCVRVFVYERERDLMHELLRTISVQIITLLKKTLAYILLTFCQSQVHDQAAFICKKNTSLFIYINGRLVTH